ncbi:MAG: hypothetical protein II670_11905 [Alphaproteobacteria bacterium]|nr:hypothetical protein [Alphaproteobacteria bacterium]
MNDNFKGRKPGDSRQRYLRYDDVFMSPKRGAKQRNTKPSWESSESWNEQEEPEMSQEYDDYRSSSQEYIPEDEAQETGYFSGQNNIINERMIRYQKRKLPPLQRYNPNVHRDAYAEFNQSYWDSDRGAPRRQRLLPFGELWQKFIITFASILSLVCISWLIYNWNSNSSHYPRDSHDIPIIEPSQSSFKVLPEAPGGADIPYKDKAVYGVVDNSIASDSQEERLLPPQEETFQIPERHQAFQGENDVEEYSIVSEKLYFIKLSPGKDRQVLLNEAKLLKKKYGNVFEGKDIFVKKVSSSKGDTQRAILVGPYTSQQMALDVAKKLGERCSVISVRE